MEISLKNIKGKLVTVMGLGLNGGGLATAKFFAENDAEVIVTDLKSSEDLAPSIKALEKYSNIKFILGEHRIDDFKNADIVIKNPAVKLEGNKFLKEAKQIESDISVFLAISKAPILAITGSKGKSSTVNALFYGLKKLGYNAFLGGNITVSPLSFIEQTNEDTPVVLELSSWQLSDLKKSKLLKPKIAIITPIMPDHQNWYGSMEKYVADKKIIYQNMDEDDFLICNNDDAWGKIFAEETRAKKFWYSENQLPQNKCGVFFDKDQNGFCKINSNNKTQDEKFEIQNKTENTQIENIQNENCKTEKLLSAESSKIPGIKLKQNVLNASLALLLYSQKSPRQIMEAMKNYGGLEHRLEFFHTYKGIKFYNDTTATIPEAVVSALKAFSNPPILICGGTDKNLDFTLLAENAFLAKKNIFIAGQRYGLANSSLGKKRHSL